MKIDLQTFALPLLSGALGGRKVTVEFDGGTVADLINHLVAKYGEKARKALLDQSGKLDLSVQILHNEKNWITHDKLDTALTDGDGIILMLLMAGG